LTVINVEKEKGQKYMQIILWKTHCISDTKKNYSVNFAWGTQKFAVPTGCDVVQNDRNSLTLHKNSLPPSS